MYYTDIHSHMLFGTDDGPSDEQGMFEMLDAAYSSGTRVICFSPHFHVAGFGDNKEAGERAYAKACEYAAEKYPDMRLYIGNELYFYFGALDAVGEHRCRTMNGTRYVLVDFPFDSSYKTISSALSSMLGYGIRPIFAHVERYACIKPPFRELYALKDAGVVIQINSTSICGLWGRALQKKATKLLRAYIPDIVATDAHDMDVRHPRLDETEKVITKLCGAEYAERLLRLNPNHVIGIDKKA